jgi:TPR repeat protein
MLTYRVHQLAAFSALAAVLLAGAPAIGQTFDRKAAESSRQSPWAVFKFGYSAYQRGEMKDAVEAYRYAAENGQLGATWTLGRMYAEGDGVPRDDYEAFKFFNAIAAQDVEPGSPEEAYVSDALVAVAGYLRTGIPGSPIVGNPAAAQDYYMRAAAHYRNAEAQYEMGRMYLLGEGVRPNLKQAGRWLHLAAEKGHLGAQALLGDLLFKSGKVVRGLALMTAALERAGAEDQAWIRNMQEEAFALAAENDRRTAIALSQDILNGSRQP